MSIFTRMFRRGGPRDPEDPGENGGPEGGVETAGDSSQVAPVRPDRDEGRLSPDGSVEAGGTEDTGITARRTPSSFALPPGVVPRSDGTEPDAGGGNGQMSAGRNGAP